MKIQQLTGFFTLVHFIFQLSHLSWRLKVDDRLISN